VTARTTDGGKPRRNRRVRPPVVTSIQGNAYSVTFPRLAPAIDPLEAQEQLLAVLDALLTKAQTGQLRGIIWVSDDLGRPDGSQVGAAGSYWTQRARAANALAEAVEVMTPGPLRVIDGGRCSRDSFAA